LNVVSPLGRNSIAGSNFGKGREEFATGGTDIKGSIVTRFNFFWA
jgi:hypothetical protein